jgi:hypothetical protein
VDRFSTILLTVSVIRYSILMYIWTSRLDTAHVQNVKMADKMSSHGELNTNKTRTSLPTSLMKHFQLLQLSHLLTLAIPDIPTSRSYILQRQNKFCTNVQSLSHVTYGKSKKTETACFKKSRYNFGSTFLNTDRITWDTSKILHFTFRFNKWHHRNNRSWPLHS